MIHVPLAVIVVNQVLLFTASGSPVWPFRDLVI